MSDHTDTPDPLDAALNDLFASARPDPALEDRLVRSLRLADATPRRPFTWRRHPLAWGVAASVGLGAVGAAVSSQMSGTGIPLPWETAGGREVASSDDTMSLDVNGVAPGEGRPDLRNWFLQQRARVERAKGYDGEPATPPSGSSVDLALGSVMKSGRADFEFSDTTARGRAGTPPLPAGGTAPPGNNLFGYYGTTTDGRPGRPTQFSPEVYRWKDTADNKPAFGVPATGFGEMPKPEQGQATGTNGTVARTATRGEGVNEFDPVAVKLAKPGNTFQPPPVAADPAPANRRVILRSGEVEFEIESFDSAVAAVTKLVTAIDGAFVATVNSEKLPNGKVKGSVVVRVPPEKLDGLVLDLRRDLGRGGELKGQRIGSQDVTKQYTDLESRLKAARTMETRLLAIIKDGKGEIKQLLDAEKELGVWRTKIEEMEGEKRYYDTLVALSTLTITLAEKEIKAAAGVTESEVVQTGVEVEDVEQAFRDALAAVAAANGRVTKSDLKQVSSGQFNATLNFEIAPDAAGPVRDRLRQLGRVARLEITRQATADTGTVTKDAKVKKGDTRFEVQLYNVTAMTPRETITLRVATPDVPTGYKAVKEAVEKAKGRMFVASQAGGDKLNPTAQLDFEVKRTEEAAVMAAVTAAGETVYREATRVAEADTVTDTKVLVRLQLLVPHQLDPREKIALAVEVADVDAAGAVLTAAVKDAGGRVADSGTNTDRGTGKITARYVCDVPLQAVAGIAEKAKAAGAVKVNQASRNNAAPDGRYATARLDVTFSTPDRIVAPDDGFAPQLKTGLSYSAKALFASLSWLVFGLLVVLPWAVVLYGGYRLVRRLVRPAAKG